ncbi:MAG: hypothetical protein ABFR75_11135 [Acidobacteriota bacterium]
MIFLGKVTKKRGNRGEVICQTSPDITISDINFDNPFVLRSEKHEKEFAVEFYKKQGSSLILKFFKIDSINESLKLIGYNVYCELLKEIVTGPDLKGFNVIDVEGNSWGKVEFVEKNKFTGILNVVEGDDVYLIPLSDEIIIEINENEKLLLIDPPDGLRDLNKQ